MSFKKLTEKDKKPNLKRVGTFWEADEFKGLYLQIDPDCDLMLYDRNTGKYYKVNRMTAKTTSGDVAPNAIFNFFVNLDNDKHVIYQGSDEDVE